MKYSVILSCRTGTHRLQWDTCGTLWESKYHEITWCIEDDLQTAYATADSLQQASPREIRAAWVSQHD